MEVQTKSKSKTERVQVSSFPWYWVSRDLALTWELASQGGVKDWAADLELKIRVQNQAGRVGRIGGDWTERTKRPVATARGRGTAAPARTRARGGAGDLGDCSAQGPLQGPPALVSGGQEAGR